MRFLVLRVSLLAIPVQVLDGKASLRRPQSPLVCQAIERMVTAAIVYVAFTDRDAMKFIFVQLQRCLGE